MAWPVYNQASRTNKLDTDRGLAQCHQPFSAEQQPPLLQAGHPALRDKPGGDHEH